MPSEIHAAIAAYCKSHGLSASDAINSLLASAFGLAFVPGRQRTGLAGADDATRKRVVRSRGTAKRK